MYNLEILKPIGIDDLVRCGRNYDGGYVLSQSQIRKTKVLLSFGINADYTFEYDFFEKSQKAEIYAYDYSTPKALSVGLIPQKSKIIKNLSSPKVFVYKVFMRIQEHLWRKKHPFNDFFDKSKNRYFYEKFVGREDKEQFVSIDTVFKNIKNPVADNDVFVKIDIECAEYDIIPLFEPYLHLINGFVIEFHNLGNEYGQSFNGILPLLLERFYIIHIHANNIAGFVKDTNLPSCLEITFINKSLIKKQNHTSLPIGLDFPCAPYLPEIELIGLR